jgi:hypothetical protein
MGRDPRVVILVPDNGTASELWRASGPAELLGAGGYPVSWHCIGQDFSDDAFPRLQAADLVVLVGFLWGQYGPEALARIVAGFHKTGKVVAADCDDDLGPTLDEWGRVSGR